jgi:hypothetical protein
MGGLDGDPVADGLGLYVGSTETGDRSQLVPVAEAGRAESETVVGDLIVAGF